MVRVFVRVREQQDNDEWAVTADLCTEAGTQPLLDPQSGQPAIHRFWVDTSGLHTFPLPLANEARQLANPQLRHLCENADEVDRVFKRITGRGPEKGDIELFGQYLFTTLLGTNLWELMKAAHPGRGKTAELALCWQAGDAVLNRFPWEMMCDDQENFLSAQPDWAITRRVTDSPITAQYTLKIKTPPRVLFVIGTHIYDEMISPGAEYLGILRGLHRDEWRLKTHLLLQATSRKLEATVKWFKPDVVHFICHGQVDSESGETFLQIVDNDDSEKTAKLFSHNLEQILRDEQDALPPVVVLNACYTADLELQEAGERTMPFAANLVTQGVPIVVGMAGRVADLACRLFSRRFYESLLEGGGIAFNAAAGRRAALAHSSSDPLSVDWAFPALFLAEQLTTPRLSINPMDADRNWYRMVHNSFAPPNYPAFCGRLRILHWFDLLMADEETQNKVLRRSVGFQALAITTREPDTPGGRRFGRSYLLQELASVAIRNGHVPCLLLNKNDQIEDWPKSKDALIKKLKKALDDTASLLGLDWESPAIEEDSVKEFREALLELLEAARKLRQERERKQMKLVLLIDDVHKMGDVASYFLRNLCGSQGLRSKVSFGEFNLRAADDVRLVITGASKASTGQEEAVKAIDDWKGGNWVYHSQLGRFNSPVEDRLAYSHFLMNWRDETEQNETEGNQKYPNKLVLVTPTATNRHILEYVFTRLRRKIDGVPSSLKDKAPEVIEDVLEMQEENIIEQCVLRKAVDDDIIKEMLATNPGQ